MGVGGLGVGEDFKIMKRRSAHNQVFIFPRFLTPHLKQR